jgi:hypothetical protein
MPISVRVLFAAIFLIASLSTKMLAQTPTADVGCTLKKDVYTCDRNSFVTSLKSATTIAVETQGTDHTTGPQLRELIHKLGKTAQTAPADLTFLLIPVASDGMYVGPSGSELATLRVYGPSPEGQRGRLLWAETYIGQADMPWPAIVHALIQQFQTKFK